VGLIKFELTEQSNTSNLYSLSGFSQSELISVANEEFMENISLTFFDTSVSSLKQLAGVNESDTWDDAIAVGLREKIREEKETLGLDV
jgi:hypothetical protein